MKPFPRILLGLRPLDPWLPSLLRRYARLFKFRYSVERRLGAMFLLDQTSKVDRNLLLKGVWEPECVSHVMALTEKHMAATDGKSAPRRIFMDIGAHGAFYAILAAKNAAFDRVVVVEADPNNVAKIHSNLLLNDLVGKVEVIQALASGKAGSMAFNRSTDSSRSHVGAGAGTPGAIEESTRVPTIRLGDVVQERSAYVVCKIDVEGHEHDVLDGMEALLRDNFCVLQIECHGDKVAPLYVRMEALGYTLDRVIERDHFFVKTGIAVAAQAA